MQKTQLGYYHGFLEIKGLSKNIVVLDCDDVLADSKHIFAAGISEQIGRIVNPLTWNDYNLTRLYPDLDWNKWVRWIIDNNTLLSIPVNPMAKILIDDISQHSEVIILTARGFHPNGKQQTLDWASKNELNINDVIVTDNTTCKSSVLRKLGQISFYVDDNGDYFTKSLPLSNIKNSYLMDQPWNQHIFTKQRIKCLSELIINV